MNKLATAASVPRQFDHVPCESGPRLTFKPRVPQSLHPGCVPIVWPFNELLRAAELEEPVETASGFRIRCASYRSTPASNPTGSWAEFCNGFALNRHTTGLSWVAAKTSDRYRFDRLLPIIRRGFATFP
jgi:hypothetical protein